MRATSSKNKQMSAGELTTDMETSEMVSVNDSRILAFHGYENERIASVGQISVNLSCIMGVTTTESVEEPILIDIEQVTDNSNEYSSDDQIIPDEHAWIFILVGVLLGVSIMCCVAACLVCYKQKKCCFATIAGNQTMPI